MFPIMLFLNRQRRLQLLHGAVKFSAFRQHLGQGIVTGSRVRMVVPEQGLANAQGLARVIECPELVSRVLERLPNVMFS